LTFKENPISLNERIKAARGDRPVDLLLTNARIIDVFGKDIIEGRIAICSGHVVGFGDYEAKDQLDLGGRFAAPGFIDAHVHIESAMVGVTEFGRAVLLHGTTAIVADPHEIANVFGTLGIDYMLQSAQDQPINVYYGLPSCVPATAMESAGASLKAADLAPYWACKNVVALAEMMNFPGVIYEDPDVLAKIIAAKKAAKPLDGHAPGVSGKQLNAYLSAGIASDHECTTLAEAKEKLRAGIHIMVREGTCSRNLDALFPLINSRTARRMMWCTDDRHPHDLIYDGHIDAIVRKAISKGLDPVTAIQMATLNPAEYFRLDHIGAVAPGRQADLVVFSDLYQPVIEDVFHMGKQVVADGKLLPNIKRLPFVDCPSSMKLNRKRLNFSVKAEGRHMRVIDLISNQIITGQLQLLAPIKDDKVVADPGQDLLKLAVIERHKGSGAMGLGFVRGFGMQKGALASSVAHDSHNIIVVGENDRDMMIAVTAVQQMGGGLVVAADEKIMAVVPLPIAGLMSKESVATVQQQMDTLLKAAQRIGATPSDPFMSLSFLALPVIPELKLTDQGLVDVNRFKVVPLFIS
jgi:adenine deaminase